MYTEVPQEDTLPSSNSPAADPAQQTRVGGSHDKQSDSGIGGSELDMKVSDGTINPQLLMLKQPMTVSSEIHGPGFSCPVGGQSEGASTSFYRTHSESIRSIESDTGVPMFKGAELANHTWGEDEYVASPFNGLMRLDECPGLI